MTTRKESIIEKIQALMARANHATANEHEAVACAAKAAELMQKYGVESSDLQEKVTITHNTIKVKQQKWVDVLAAVIRDAFNVQVIKSNKDEIMFVGESVNLEVVMFVFDQLKNKIESLVKAYVKEWFMKFWEENGQPYKNWTAQYANTKSEAAQRQFLTKSYCLGVCAELRKKMVAPKNAQQQQQGLVLVRKEIDEYVRNFGMTLRKAQRRSVSVDGDAREAGNMAGRNININSGLGSKTGQKLLG